MMHLTKTLIERVAERFRAMGDPTRIRILVALRQGPGHVGALVQGLDLPQTTVSKHLAILRAAGLVRGTRRGSQVVYETCDPDLGQLCDIVCASVARSAASEHASISFPLGPEPVAHPV
jgi:ArsR family transcriptional regulator